MLRLLHSYLLLMCMGLTSSRPSQPSSLDAVTLSLLQSLWDTPASYQGSGSSIPEEWKPQFGHLVHADAERLLSDVHGCTIRSNLLEHISRRSSILLEKLPPSMNWTQATEVLPSDLAKFRIINDESWGLEFKGGKEECFTVEAAARRIHAPVSTPAKRGTSVGTHRDRLTALRTSAGEWTTTFIVVGESPSGPFTLLTISTGLCAPYRYTRNLA
jgi:hypothetical protein